MLSFLYYDQLIDAEKKKPKRNGGPLYFLLCFWLCSASLLHVAFPSHEEWGLLSRCRALAFHCDGLSGCRPWALGHTGLAGLGQVKSSQIRDQTCIPCVARQILSHWTTRGDLRSPYIV